MFILTRSAFAGLQRYASATWSGDITLHLERVQKADPRRPRLLLSGLPYWTVDSGGFAVPKRFTDGQNAAEWRELNTRWFSTRPSW